jgi:uroporphyrinogen decarboxylase
MSEMTSIERVSRVLDRKPVDRPPSSVSPWETTLKKWIAEGHVRADEDVHEHFDQDIRRKAGDLNVIANLNHEDVVLEETEETVLKLDGNGATYRRHKLHESMPEHVDFSVKDRASWEELIKPFLVGVDRRRIPFEEYRCDRAFSAEKQRFFCIHGYGPFECMQMMCGHENLLMGMALDPDWVKDMVMTYVDMTINHLELLYAEEGLPDAMYFAEDLGFKGKPFMSPAMYQDIMQPGHKRLFDYVHSTGRKVIIHSCGYVEPLVPGLIEAGMDCLQAMEVKAGMDLPKLFDQFGDRIAFYGGIDVRVLASNDRKQIDEELKKVSYVVNKGGGYILHSDHSEPPEVEYVTMRYFIERGREAGRRKR